MSDLISRQDAIDAVKHAWAKGLEPSQYIEELPSVQPTHAQWKKAYADHVAFGERPFYRYCSECCEVTVFPFKFCPNCGARMDEEGGHDDHL